MGISFDQWLKIKSDLQLLYDTTRYKQWAGEFAEASDLDGKPLRIIVTSGHFDPLRAWHVAFLEAAAALGSVLVVLLCQSLCPCCPPLIPPLRCRWRQAEGACDALVSPEEKRAVLRGLRSVDIVLPCTGAMTCLELVQLIEPALYLKESLWKPQAEQWSRFLPEGCLRFLDTPGYL